MISVRFRADGQMYRPIMIHRAVLGSLERMIAILAENFGGKWWVCVHVYVQVQQCLNLEKFSFSFFLRPFWLSPAQVMVVPVGGDSETYGQEVRRNGSLDKLNLHIKILLIVKGFDASCSGFKVVSRLREAGFMADIDDDRGNTLNKKIRSAQLAQYNYIFGKDSFRDVAIF